ncbi:hypothetical protein B484DRAFT_455502 [Ochromonadaceae sp. CCMP2298]|nr:hypothetical protein B484DRAFT_455502 [Ochromonadaceae sp. CCMP2298]
MLQASVNLEGWAVWSSVAACTVAYMLVVAQFRMRRYNRLDKMSAPAEDDLTAWHEIYLSLVYKDFPTLTVKVLEFGLLKSYAIPSISSLLVQTRELVDRVPRRYDDTDFIVREIMENPPNSPRNLLALRRLNFLHGKYTISQKDYLYVLLIFAVEPIRWIDLYGFRKVHPMERHAAHLIWRDYGTKMGIENIPPDFEGMEAHLDRFEQEKMKFALSNQLLGVSTMQLLLSVVPGPLHGFARRAAHALCSPRLREAMGFPDPPPGLGWALQGLLGLAGLFQRYFMLPRSEVLRRTPLSGCPFAGAGAGVGAGAGEEYQTMLPLFHPYEQTYAKGYRIDELGPVQFAGARELGDLFPCSPKK